MRHRTNIFSTCGRRPSAAAIVRGSTEFPMIGGTVTFFRIEAGVIVKAQIWGLPKGELCSSQIFGFHIHEGGSCSGGTPSNPFPSAGSHFNPAGCRHPHHAGDLPPLFGCAGVAYTEFLTDRFTVNDIIGKTVIIHRNPDDFTTQPSGNSGEMIACGVIRA